MKKQKPEQALALVKHIQATHPGVRFRVDALGLHHTPAQAGQHKAQNPWRGWPDLQIPLPRGPFAGLWLELKAEGTALHCTRPGRVRRTLGWEATTAAWYQDVNTGKVLPCKAHGRKYKCPVFDTKVRMPGDWVDFHIEEQAELLAWLRGAHQVAYFAVGLRRAKALVDGYLREDLGLIRAGLEGTGQTFDFQVEELF